MSLVISDEDRREIRFLTVATSLTLLCMVELIAHGDPGTTAKIYRALGPTPYGIPVQIYVPLFAALLWAPVPYFVYHAVMVMRFAAPQQEFARGLRGVLARLRYLGNNHGEELPIRRAKRAGLLSFVYGTGVMIWWGYWAQTHF